MKYTPTTTLGNLIRDEAAPMSEHTPTTEEVRAHYAGERWCIDQQFRRNALAEFDRWLAQVRAEVAEEIAQAVNRSALSTAWTAKAKGLREARDIAREWGGEQ